MRGSPICQRLLIECERLIDDIRDLRCANTQKQERVVILDIIVGEPFDILDIDENIEKSWVVRLRGP
jgi:hypothetical protein